MVNWVPPPPIFFFPPKTAAEREFYINLSIKEHYGKRELERQISSGLFERVIMGNQRMPSIKNQIPQYIANTFRDPYVFEFLNLPELHSEKDLQKALLAQLKAFIIELGKDFLFIQEEYRLQVGNSDFFIDLLFYHRSLRCLAAFELKADKFKPEYLGQLNFYLEARTTTSKTNHQKKLKTRNICSYQPNQLSKSKK